MGSFSLYDNQLRINEYQPRVVAYYYKQWVDYRMPSHHEHHAVEIMYVITGKCMIEMKDSQLILKKGDFILIDSGVSHRLIVEDDGPCRMLNIEFVFEEQENRLPSIKELALSNDSVNSLLSMESPYIVLRDQNEVYLTLKSLVLELDEGKRDNTMMSQLLLCELLIRIARIVADEAVSNPLMSDMYIRKGLEYIHHHYDCDIQMKDIASAVNLHPSYFHRIFKQSMACTMVEYLTAFRIEKAKMLLTETDIPVIDISGYVGMNSRQYFSSVFKKHTGDTPIDFRKRVEKVKWNHENKS